MMTILSNLSWINTSNPDSLVFSDMYKLGLVGAEKPSEGLLWSGISLILFAVLCFFIYRLRRLSFKSKAAMIILLIIFIIVGYKAVLAIEPMAPICLDRVEKCIFFIYIIILCLSFVILVFQTIVRWNKKYENLHKSSFLKQLVCWMFFIWSLGIVFHFIAFALNKYPFHWVELIARSITCSFTMFLSGIDSNILDSIKNYPFLKSILTGIGLLAMGCTIVFILGLIYARFICSIKMYYASCFSKKRNLYIFWGINEQSVMLARNIRKREEEERTNNTKWYHRFKKSYRIIFIVKNLSDNKSETELSGWNSIVNLFIHRSETFRIVNETHSLLAIINSGIESLASNDKSVLESMGLSNIYNILQKQKEDKKTHLFLLSNDEKENKQIAYLLLKDNFMSKRSNTYIYCHARYNNINKVLEDQSLSCAVHVRIVDSSRLCINLLKMKDLYQPVNFVDVNQDGTVNSTFRALILGFSEVGRDAANYLYEFSSFVSPEEKDTNTHRSPFIIDIVDEDVVKKSGKFRARRPSVQFVDGTEEQNNTFNTIYLHNWSINSYPYHSFLKDKISELNYIIIALGNDEQNMIAAIDILNAAMRYRKNLDKFKIFIRAYSKDAEENMIHLETYFNALAKAERDNADSKEKGNEIPVPFCIFGKMSELYSYEIIVGNKIQSEADRYQFVYNQTTDSKNSSNPEEAVDFSVIRHINKIEVPKLDSPKSFSEIQSRKRKDQQNLENSLHKQTKLLLAEKALRRISSDTDILHKVRVAMRDKEIRRLRSEIEYKIENDISDVSPDKIKDLLLVLAKTEHLRWNASHEMLGYEYNEGQTIDLRYKHYCLCEWQKLASEEIRSYDNNVVDVTLGTDIDKEGKETHD